MPKLKHIMFSWLYLDKLLKGEKSLTIRAKKPNLKPGDLALVHSQGMILGKVRILSVQAKRLKDLGEEEAAQEGFQSVDQLKEALKKHYPHLKDSSYVYLIKFEWVERYDSPLADGEHAWPYALTPAEVAQLALSSGIELAEEDREILSLLAKEKSIRRAAVKLGGLSLRPLVRGVVRRAALELEKKGLLQRAASS
uniref:ASCH domain-containing protein n=1 Tax=Thermofilum pendens TaxID=2269 RepID=A0A7J3X5Y5_THEPE